jgi:ribosomal protein L16 Arg81 hydroxylase
MQEYHFQDYVGDAEVFLAEYFNKTPFLRRQAFARRLDDLRSMIDLDQILALEALPPSYIRITKDGMGIPGKAYRRIVENGSVLTETIDPEKVYQLFACGATVTWNALHHVIPALRRLIGPLGDTFACSTEAGLFVTPAGNRGFAPHCDSVDVFVVQVDGTKDWKVWATPDVRSGRNASFSLEDLGQPVLEEKLEPGDVLYIPYGTAHAATAQRTMSVHLSIGVQPRRWRHLLQNTVEMILADDEFYEFPMLVRRKNDEAVDEFERQLGKLAERLRGVDPEYEMQRLVSAGRSRNGASCREFERLKSVDDFNEETILRPSSVDLRIGERTAGRVMLTTGEVQVSLPEALVTALEALERGHAVRAAEFLPGVPASRSVRAAQELARLGALEEVEEI